MKKIRNSLKFLLFCFIAVACYGLRHKPADKKQPEAFEVTKPNVLIIFPDQLRRYSAGFWSEEKYIHKVIGKPDPVVTPNIDRLAKGGVVFTNAIANFPLCSPSRGMLLTGLYPEKNGIWNNCLEGRQESLKDNVQTITDVFYQQGYNTAYFGKCHWLMPQPYFDETGNYVGTSEKPGGHLPNNYDNYVPAGPARHQIEYFFQTVKDSHFSPMVYSNDPNTIEGKKDGELFQSAIYSPKIEAQTIINYLQNKNNVRDTKKPFFMMWSLNPPHPPVDDANTEMDVVKKYYGTDKFPVIDSNLVVRKNANYKVANFARNYFAAVTSIDTYIGQVLDELQKMGVLDNTIVLFSSDHGELLGSHDLTGKNQVETESLAVPLIIHWPKGLKSDINDVLFGTPDIMPTILGLAGLSNKIPKEVEGNNFASLLKSTKTAGVQNPESVLVMLGNARGVYTGRYTLCVQEAKKGNGKKAEKSADEVFLYDNLLDPYQFNKIKAEQMPDLFKKLLGQLGVLLKKYNDPWYQNKKHSEIISYPNG